MNLDHDICYRALRTRDHRFFTGGTSIRYLRHFNANVVTHSDGRPLHGIGG